MTHMFTDRQLTTLRAVCDTLIPALDCPPDRHGLYARAASDLNVAERLDTGLPDVIDAAAQMQLRLFLDALDQSLVNGLLNGIAHPFVELSLDQRTLVLRTWSESRVPQQRQAFQAVKRLTFFMFYSALDERQQNPNWPALGYNGPPNAVPSSDKPIKPLTFTEETTLRADAVIIGSGAGGGVMAGELAAAGLDVIVVEKGGYYAEADFSGLELSSNQRLFENQGLCTTADLGVVLLAGSTLGGGTVINWSASFRTPEAVMHEWEQDYGVGGFTGKEYQAALDTVCKRINVNERECMVNAQNAILERGGKALGYETRIIPRNVKGCEECGFCTFGCAFGAKQSTLKTYLQDAYNRGARIAVNFNAERVLIEYGQAVGVVGTALDGEGQRVKVTIRARVVVAAAGAIHTPALLLRSGLGNAHIGRNLHLHPTTVTFGMYETSVCGWQGPPMTRYVSQFTSLDEAAYGFVLETAPVHPGLAGLTLSWSDGLQHKRVMANLDHLSNVIVIVRDRDGGRVGVNRAGKPIVHYTLSDYDKKHLVRGVGEALRVLTAAGAYQVSAPHSVPRSVRFEPSLAEADKRAALEQFIGGMTPATWQPNRFALFSAHQMSSCRMGGSPARGALDPTGESFEARNLFVADGSVLPTAVGRNPMVTIMAVAHVIAQHVKARLKKG
ncbi:MAG: GMC family oxidoreductase N-terminal domain-containing protein [Aggregatilineales bacterium]